jgi:hypothetical protein
MQQIKRDFPLQASQVVYRYCPALAAKAREFLGKHYQQFVDYFGTDLVTYPDGKTMAEAMQKFYQYQSASAPKAEVEALLQRHHLSASSPQINWSPDLLACEDGIGGFFNPDEGQEMMTGFDEVPVACKNAGALAGGSGGHQAIPLRRCHQSPICSQTVQDYGDASIAAAFLIPQDYDKPYLEYLRAAIRHFYRNRYPSLNCRCMTQDDLTPALLVLGSKAVEDGRPSARSTVMPP